ncbi:MAG: hypothetical protein J7501_02705 [Bdellovibrio sp.]|nr:hypothetical protein [Bdellovibrio sp.]
MIALLAASAIISCFSETNYNHRLDLVVHSEYSSVLGASVYDVKKGETAESTYSETLAAGTMDPMAPYFLVTLKNGKELTIDYDAVGTPALGAVQVDNETYICREIL